MKITNSPFADDLMKIISAEDLLHYIEELSARCKSENRDLTDHEVIALHQAINIFKAKAQITQAPETPSAASSSPIRPSQSVKLSQLYVPFRTRKIRRTILQRSMQNNGNLHDREHPTGAENAAGQRNQAKNVLEFPVEQEMR